MLPGESRRELQRLPAPVAATLDTTCWHTSPQFAALDEQPTLSIHTKADANSDADEDGGDADKPSRELIDVAPSSRSALLSQIALMDGDDDFASFPTGRVDVDGQQVDLREKNSWHLRLHEVPLTEAIETQWYLAIALSTRLCCFG